MPTLSFEPRRAVRAIRALLRDPEDLPQVFTIIEALSGPAPARLLARFRRTPSGTRLLAARPDIVTLLEDREGLRRLPAGSLGRAYLAFVESENISAAGIRAASAEGGFRPARSSEHEYVKARLRDTHDLWHALTGYRGDLVGEAVLLSFILAQTWNPGIGFLVATAFVKANDQPDPARRAEFRRLIVDGFRRGRAAAWLPDQEWEALLPLPLGEVRRRLGIEAPPAYATIRPADLRVAAAA